MRYETRVLVGFKEIIGGGQKCTQPLPPRCDGALDKELQWFESPTLQISPARVAAKVSPSVWVRKCNGLSVIAGKVACKTNAKLAAKV